jgi:predicted dehydrogenase
MSGATTTVAVVGLGYWGPNLLRVLVEMHDVRVKWICDLDPARLERFQRRYPALGTTKRVDTVLEDEEVEAIFLATPVFTHFDLASRALRAGKHTFVEKPLASSTDMAEQLRRMAHERDLRLMCGHTFVYSPPVRALKEMLERDELGTLFFVSSSRVNLGLHQRDVSVIWDLGPHDFSILLYWLDEMPASVRAVGRDSIVRGVPDVAFVTLSFPSGVLASVELSWLAPSKLRRTVVVGSEKMVVYDDGTNEPLRVFDHGVVYQDPETFGQYHLAYRTGDILSPKVATYEPLSAELADFIQAVRSGRSLDWQAMLGQNVVRITEAADESLRNGGSKVSLDGELFAAMHPRALDDAHEDAWIP